MRDFRLTKFMKFDRFEKKTLVFLEYLIFGLFERIKQRFYMHMVLGETTLIAANKNFHFAKIVCRTKICKVPNVHSYI